MDVSAIVSVANVAILIALIILYGRTYGSSRASFALGLIFFASLLLIQNAIGIYSYIAMAPFFAEAILPYLLAIHITELAGLSILLKITW
ncbi:MAG: hypothetical protein QXW73_04180 [Nitrososphaerales archaeon]